jgi:alpha-glutamyl/putrescinyl thymine pyrophosphorylase clade 1
MQHLADLNYSPLLDGFDEDDYVRPGPGCVAGINLCFGLKLKPSNASDMKRAGDVVRLCCDQQEQHFQNLGLQPVALLGRRRLKLIDIQNLYCEISKFSKLAFPKLHSQGATVRSYDPTSAPSLPPLTLPAKWRRFPWQHRQAGSRSVNAKKKPCMQRPIDEHTKNWPSPHGYVVRPVKKKRGSNFTKSRKKKKQSWTSFYYRNRREHEPQSETKNDQVIEGNDRGDGPKWSMEGQLQSIEFRLALMCALYLDEDTKGINRVIDGLNTIRDQIDR